MDFAAARKCSTNFSTTGLTVRCFSLKMATRKDSASGAIGNWSSLSTGYGPRLRCGKPFIHAGRTLRLVGMLGAGTLSGSEPFHRCAPALEEDDDGPQDT